MTLFSTLENHWYRATGLLREKQNLGLVCYTIFPLKKKKKDIYTDAVDITVDKEVLFSPRNLFEAFV